MKNGILKLTAAIVLCLAVMISAVGCGKWTDTVSSVSGTGSDISSGTASGTDVSSGSSDASPSVSGISSGTSSKMPPHDEVDLSKIPSYTGSPYVVLGDNIPYFSDISAKSFESYSPLDTLLRCGVAVASVGRDIMPTEERGEIGQIKPTGWQTVKYDIVSGKYLYNRCHLIGYQLTGENANNRNLITGTRYLNVDGMLPFENLVADYVKETGNHVMYRVTPIFDGKNLVARGVRMEGWSVEDEGDGVCFDIFCYNVQPGIVIDYSNGNSRLDTPATNTSPTTSSKVTQTKPETQTPAAQTTPVAKEYVLNTNTYKFHLPTCGDVKKIKDENKATYSGTRDDVIKKGYSPCKHCNP